MTERTGQFTRMMNAANVALETARFDLAAELRRVINEDLRRDVAARIDDSRSYVVRFGPVEATRRGDTIDYSRTAYVALADPDSAELGEWAIPSADLLRDARGIGDLAECDGKLWRVAPWAWQRISNEEALSDESDE